MDGVEQYGNRRRWVERLVSAWDHGFAAEPVVAVKADDPLIGLSPEPTRRTRTPLTAKEVDAMRTARDEGVSVTALAKLFGVHRATVWAKCHQP